MTEEELDKNLGTIAQKCSLKFKEDMTKQDKVDIIGQFGVGFYSAFMVSDCIEVETKSVDSEKGINGYPLVPKVIVLKNVIKKKMEPNFFTYQTRYRRRKL